MNRAERRKAGFAGHVATYNYTREQIDSIIQKEIQDQYQQIKKEITKLAVERTFAAFCISLHDLYGFGPARINNLLQKVNNQFECVDAGTASLEEMMKWCKEYGVKFE